jgi:hypothetical protein
MKKTQKTLKKESKKLKAKPQNRDQKGRFAKKIKPKVLEVKVRPAKKSVNKINSFKVMAKPKNQKKIIKKIKKEDNTNYSFWLKVMAFLLSILSSAYYTQRFLRFNGLNIIGLTTIFRNFNLFPDTNYQLLLSLNPVAAILLDTLFIAMAIAVLVNLFVSFVTLLSIRDWFFPNVFVSLVETGIIVSILLVLFLFFEFNVYALLTYLGLFFMLAFAFMKIGTAVWNFFIKG